MVAGFVGGAGCVVVGARRSAASASAVRGAAAGRARRARVLQMAVSEVESQAALDAALDAAEDSLVVIDFSTTWCGPCKMVAPKFEAMSNTYSDVVFLKVTGDKNAETNAIMKSSNIKSVPAFHFYKNRSKIFEVVGAKVDDIEAGILENK